MVENNKSEFAPKQNDESKMQQPEPTASSSAETNDFAPTPDSVDTETSSGQSEIEKIIPQQSQEQLFVSDLIAKSYEQAGQYIIGQKDVLELMLIGLIANGHVLLEGTPGLAKTLSAKVLSRLLHVDFNRIQFTPDLMPSDVTGTNVFNFKTSDFNFNQGPIFSNIVLIDEINRAPAKTQAALFEVMEEKQVTIDGKQTKLEEPFFVVATMNPIEQEGTYNLPEAQLDRFLFKVKLGYPSVEEEFAILYRYKNELSTPSLDKVKPIFTAENLKKAKEIVEQVNISDEILTYIANIIVKTRNHNLIYLGASPRASLSLVKTSKTLALLRGRQFVTPDDIKYLAPHILNHRIILTPEAEIEGVTEESIISEIVSTVEVPR